MNGNQTFHFKQVNNNLGIELGSQIICLVSILYYVLRYSYLQFLVFPSLKREFCMVIFENRILYWNLNKVIAAINSKDCNMVMGHVWWQCLKRYKIYSLNEFLQMFLLRVWFLCFLFPLITYAETMVYFSTRLDNRSDAHFEI